MMRQTTLPFGETTTRPRRCMIRTALGSARFATDPPPGARCLGETMLRIPPRATLVSLSICDCVSDDDLAHEPSPACTDIPLLISNLQKAIRRGLAPIASRTAVELAHSDVLALVRRLPVIAIEDVSPETHLVHCVWLLLAMTVPDRYVVRRNDVRWLTAYARVLASSRACVYPPVAKMDAAASLWGRCDRQNDDVALAMLARAAHGGLPGDVRMLLASAQVGQIGAPTPPLTPPEDETRMTIADVLPAAVDFHCDGGMLRSVQACRPQFTEAEIREAIWHASSKINVRKPEACEPTHASAWAAIRDVVGQRQSRRAVAAFSRGE